MMGEEPADPRHLSLEVAAPTAVLPGGDAAASKVDLVETLTAMQYRKVFRYQRGAYVPARPMELMSMFWVMAVLVLADKFVVRVTKSGEAILVYEANLSTGDSSFWTLLAIFLMAVIQSKLQNRYSLHWLIPMLRVTLVFMLIAILVEYLTGIYGDRNSAEAGYHVSTQIAALIAVAYLIVSCIYVIYVAVARQLFPNLAASKGYRPVIRRDKTDEIKHDLNGLVVGAERSEVPAAYGVFEYTGPFFWSTARQTCQYSGSVNEHGQPHGYGIWSDDHKHGETVEGLWEHGLPVGPFKARETGSGSGFIRMRVGFFTCRAEDVNTIACMPKLAPFSVGVASTECCVSGAFFHEHPLLDPMWEELDQNPGAELDGLTVRMLDNMVTLTTTQKEPASVQIFADINSGIRVSGFVADSGTDIESITITIPRAVQDGGLEFLPGSYASIPLIGTPTAAQLQDVEEGVSKTFDKQVEAGHSTPPGSPVRGGTPKKRMSRQYSTNLGITRQVAHKLYEKKQYEQRLHVDGWLPQLGTKGAEVLIHIHGYNSACQHGVKNVAQLWSFASFPSHIKPIVFSWPTGKLLAYPFAQTKGAENAGVALALRELIISLARAGVRDFHFQTHSMGARQLMFAVPYFEDLFDRPGRGPPSAEHLKLDLVPSEFAGGLKLVNTILMNPEYGMHQFVKTRADILDRICDITTIYGDVRDAALTFSFIMNNLQLKLMKHHRATSWLPREVTASQPCRGIWKKRDTCLGLHIYDAKDEEGKYSPIDMIDCTFLQSNVQGGRHNTFTLNRSVIEDIYDVVVNRRPAMQRSNRLEPRGGNVYSFLVAPSHIVAP